MAKYDPQSYRIYLRNSIASGNNQHILVEGKDDKYLIERLWQDFSASNSPNTINQIVVDSAENLIKGDEPSQFCNNREKVEFIANSIYGQSYADDFVGFVDRELHKFYWDCDVNSELQDLIESHEVIQRLVLSRGHSIENYIFDFAILYEVLQYLSTTPYANQAIELFKETFQSALRIACSIGLAATKAQVLSETSSTIDYNFIEINSAKEVIFKLDDWTQKIDRRVNSETKKQDIKLYYSMYNEQVSKASISLIRWICHGHIGYDLLGALYERCVIDVCPSTRDKNKELSGISWVAKKKLFYSFINSWVKKSVQNQCEYPMAIFELLRVAS
ncbi:MAG: DUF4435 domain-containing protein [Symploca sp. SIO3E6]|nr:DUF4435 domain-containing protein [Caldora sp. SIO3E6]